MIKRALVIVGVFCALLAAYLWGLRSSDERKPVVQPNTRGESYFTASRNEIERSSFLQREWRARMVEYRKKFQDQLASVQTEIKQLEMTTDNGDAKLRAGINEQLADLRRAQDDLQRALDEIMAATAIKWGNVFGDFRDEMEDLKD